MQRYHGQKAQPISVAAQRSEGLSTRREKKRQRSWWCTQTAQPKVQHPESIHVVELRRWFLLRPRRKRYWWFGQWGLQYSQKAATEERITPSVAFLRNRAEASACQAWWYRNYDWRGPRPWRSWKRASKRSRLWSWQQCQVDPKETKWDSVSSWGYGWCRCHSLAALRVHTRRKITVRREKTFWRDKWKHVGSEPHPASGLIHQNNWLQYEQDPSDHQFISLDEYFVLVAEGQDTFGRCCWSWIFVGDASDLIQEKYASNWGAQEQSIDCLPQTDWSPFGQAWRARWPKIQSGAKCHFEQRWSTEPEGPAQEALHKSRRSWADVRWVDVHSAPDQWQT